MVALATPRFGFVPRVNLARPMPREALAKWPASIDNDPCGETPERSPKPSKSGTLFDDNCGDDDDHGDDWKIGGAV